MNTLTDRLRGRYAVGPHAPNSNPEFGFRQFEAPPIQHEAADCIEVLEAAITKIKTELFELCEDMEEKGFITSHKPKGEHEIGFDRGYKKAAKSIRNAMGEVIREIAPK